MICTTLAPIQKQHWHMTQLFGSCDAGMPNREEVNEGFFRFNFYGVCSLMVTSDAGSLA
jgi:hypothetical protein